MLSSKRETLEKELMNVVGSSKYLVIINGVIVRHRDNPVYVKLDEGQLLFFVRVRVEGTPIEQIVPEIKTRIINDIGSSILFDSWDFTEWSDNWSMERERFSFNMVANGNMRVLYIETDMYNIVKQTIMNEQSNNMQFSPTIDGKMLTTQQIIALRSEFNVRAFTNLLEMVKLRYLSNARKGVRGFYKLDAIFSPMMFRPEGLFNPFYDDAIIRDQVKDRLLFKLIERESMYIERANMHVSFLTDVQVSKALGLNVMIPFNFEILYQLVVGFVLTKDECGIRFPHKNKTAYRLIEQNEAFTEMFISEEEYNRSSDYKKEFYVPTTTYNKFLMQNHGYFRRHGLSNINEVMSIMREAALV